MDAPPPYPGGGGWQQPAAPPSYDESENMTKQGFPGPGIGGGFYTPGGGQFQGQGVGLQGHMPGEVERHYSSTQNTHHGGRRTGAGDGGVWRLGRGPSAGVGGDVQPLDWAVDQSTQHAGSDIDTDLDCTLTPHSPSSQTRPRSCSIRRAHLRGGRLEHGALLLLHREVPHPHPDLVLRCKHG